MDEPIRFYEVFEDREDIADHIIASGYTIDALEYLSNFQKGE